MTLKRLKIGMVSSFHPHSMGKRVESITGKTGRTTCTNWTISFEVSGFLTRTHLLHGHFIFLNLLQLQIFLRSVHTIQSDVINFQNFLTSFAIFQSFTDLFRELNDREIENHYKMNSENVETWHGIIISPTQYVQKSREGYGKNWMHFVYKLDNLFRSTKVFDENSSVTLALHFLKLLQLQTFFAFRTHHSKRRHQFSTLSDIICYFSVFYRFVQRAK